MADKINFSCDKCGAKYYGKSNMIGQNAKCVKCREVFTIKKQTVPDNSSIIELNLSEISDTSGNNNGIVIFIVIIVSWILSLIITYHIATYYYEGELGKIFIKSELRK